MLKNTFILFLFFIPLFLNAQDADRNKGIFINITPAAFVHNNVQTTRYDETGAVFSSVTDSEPVTATISYIVESGYFVIPERLSTGLGLGISLYAGTTYSYVPFYLDVKYFLSKSRNSPLVFVDYGRIFSASSDNISGSIFAIGIGLKRFFTRKLAAYVALGFNYTNFIFVEDQRVGGNNFNHKYDSNIRGLEFRFGLYF